MHKMMTLCRKFKSVVIIRYCTYGKQLYNVLKDVIIEFPCVQDLVYLRIINSKRPELVA